jgi:hypothetical protein
MPEARSRRGSYPRDSRGWSRTRRDREHAPGVQSTTNQTARSVSTRPQVAQGVLLPKKGAYPGAAGGVERTRLVEAQRRAGSRRQPPQQQVLQRFADAEGIELVEVESAKHDASKRPLLAQALAEACL